MPSRRRSTQAWRSRPGEALGGGSFSRRRTPGLLPQVGGPRDCRTCRSAQGRDQRCRSPRPQGRRGTRGSSSATNPVGRAATRAWVVGFASHGRQPGAATVFPSRRRYRWATLIASMTGGRVHQHAARHLAGALHRPAPPLARCIEPRQPRLFRGSPRTYRTTKKRYDRDA